MGEDWKEAFERDRADPIIEDLIQIHRQGWRHFDGSELRDLPSRFLDDEEDEEAVEGRVRKHLAPYLVTSRSRLLGARRFEQWDDVSRFALKLFGAHPATENVHSLTKRRELALEELKESGATQAQAVQKRPWKGQPRGGPEWRLFVRMRDQIRHRRSDASRERVSNESAAVSGRRLVELLSEVDALVGRSRELDEAREALGAARLTTITGLGGVGKTRLAVEALRREIEGDPERRVFLARLESVEEADDLHEALGRQLGLAREGRESWLDALRESIGEQPALLAMDNCEHLLEACAATATALVQACPELRILATSREPLSVSGEKVIGLQGLATRREPGEGEGASPHPPAVELFVLRAQARKNDLELSPTDFAAVENLAKQVGGLPLALEIAAGWVGRLTIHEIEAGIREELGQLTNPRKDSSARHRTMEACLDWSFRLFTEGEKRALAWASEFVGGWDAEGFRSLLGEAEEEGDEPLRDLDLLVAQSFVERREVERRSRYFMFDLVRAYAKRRLEHAGEADAARRAHLAWCLRWAAEAHDRFGGTAAESWLPRIDREWLNLRAAVLRADEEGDHESVLEFAELWWYWFLRGLWSEMRPPLERALDSGVGSEAQRAQAFLAAGTLAWAAGDLDTAEGHLDSAKAAADGENEWRESQVAHIEGHVAQHRGNLEEAESRFERALEYWKSRPTSYWEALLRDDIGSVLSELGDQDSAHSALSKALKVARSVKDRQATGNALSHLAVVHRRRGEIDAALQCGIEAQDTLRALGYRRGLATALRNLAEVQVELGDEEAAETALDEATAIQRAIGHRMGLARSAATRGRVALARGDFLPAARNLGRARALLLESGGYASRMELREEEGTMERLEAALGAERLASALAEGRAAQRAETAAAASVA